uniref:F-box domain-containing protein n=1 Tax=Oryza barthii TaxID=65489 RepID=A0A0D3F3S8_9ORYZ
MEDEATRPSSPPPAASAASSVLADDDLLREILLRLAFPTTLVRAALVSSRWLCLASDSAEFPPPPDELRFGVVSPLLPPARQPPDLPPNLHSQLHQVPNDARVLRPGWMLLPEEEEDDGGDDLSYTLVVLIRRGRGLFARAVLVRGESDDQIRTSDSIELPNHYWPNKKMNRGLLFHGSL